MINSVNTVDFSSSSSDNLLPPEMVPSEKFNLTQNNTSRIPQNSVRLSSRYTEILSQYVCKTDYSEATDNCTSTTTKTKDIVSQLNATIQQKERVKVQHLQTHSKLQNNRCNYQTFYDICAEKTEVRRDITSNNNNKNSNSSSSNIQNDSALISCYKMDDRYSTSVGMENNNNNNHNDKNNLEMSKTITAAGSKVIVSDRRASPIQRTEDQENAFRRIEDVHNYAKLNRYSYSNESSRSSVHEYENEEEEEDEIEDDDDDIVDNTDDLPTTYERCFNNNKSPYSIGNFKPHSGGGGGGSGEKRIKLNRVTVEESDTHVDVETVHKEHCETESPVVNTPDHHARRPMNAFLIFCKRHRAIVKERYKSLENRAITKILGDWWASLEVNDKKCFTNLAQQNKDAFFSANPNFKWYKLPAPPLRTLNTRPSNTERTSEHEPDDDCNRGTIQNCIKSGDGNYFKLADEAQMGELSTLMSDKGSVAQCTLQQVLGETSQFLNTHIPLSLDLTNDARGDANSSKRRLHSENSISSNSSEEDAVPKKSSRSCKGKIYQELIQSGQILAIAKKVKQPKSQLSCTHDYVTRQETVQHQHAAATVVPHESAGIMVASVSDGKDAAIKRTASESDSMQQHYDLANFDLEERIKELPALSLDTYLQRKRNTKKKKKFSSKKRNSNSVSSSKSYASVATTPSPPVTPSKEPREPPQQIVGSQKRKARKESITRRDVSAIENEVASIITSTDFNTINGCYYFNEAPLLLSKTPAAAAVTSATSPTTALALPIAANANYVPSPCTTSSTIDQFSSVFSNDNISSTSDLLILAEVAANRTELTN